MSIIRGVSTTHFFKLPDGPTTSFRPINQIYDLALRGEIMSLKELGVEGIDDLISRHTITNLPQSLPFSNYDVYMYNQNKSLGGHVGDHYGIALTVDHDELGVQAIANAQIHFLFRDLGDRSRSYSREFVFFEHQGRGGDDDPDLAGIPIGKYLCHLEFRKVLMGATYLLAQHNYNNFNANQRNVYVVPGHMQPWLDSPLAEMNGRPFDIKRAKQIIDDQAYDLGFKLDRKTGLLVKKA